MLKFILILIIILINCKFENKKSFLVFDLLTSESTNQGLQQETINLSLEVVATPTFSPPGGNYSDDQNVVIHTTTVNASIYYTTYGTEPTPSSNLYSSPISIAGDGTSITIKAIAVQSGMQNSNIASDTWTIQYNKVATPVFSPSQGYYTSPQTITITTSTTGASIYYTTDGSNPNISSMLYSSGIPIWHLAGKILKAFGVKTGLLDSNIATAVYSYPPLKTNQTNC